jgi:toll-interacting protein
MDPYVRLRVGHCVYETHTDSSGGKAPKWNKVVQWYVKFLENNFHVCLVFLKYLPTYQLTVRLHECVTSVFCSPVKYHWIFCSLLPHGVNSIYIEIYDECSFSMDELVAWTHVAIPKCVMLGETHEDWYPLNGKQGDGQEGMINLVLSYSLFVSACFPSA